MHTLNKCIFNVYEKAAVLYFGFMQFMRVIPQIGKYEYTYKYEKKNIPIKLVFLLFNYVACVLDPVLQFFIKHEEAFIKLN